MVWANKIMDLISYSWTWHLSGIKHCHLPVDLMENLVSGIICLIRDEQRKTTSLFFSHFPLKISLLWKDSFHVELSEKRAKRKASSEFPHWYSISISENVKGKENKHYKLFNLHLIWKYYIHTIRFPLNWTMNKTGISLYIYMIIYIIVRHHFFPKQKQTKKQL